MGKKIDFPAIYKIILIAFFGLAITIAGKTLFENLPAKYQWVLWLILLLAFLLSIWVVQLLYSGWNKITSWIKAPQRKNIRLSTLPLRNNEIRLRLTNREWRKKEIVMDRIEYIFPANELCVVDYYKNPAPDNSRVPIHIQKFKSFEIPFIELNARNNSFS